jgi:hypothetical protein
MSSTTASPRRTGWVSSAYAQHPSVPATCLARARHQGEILAGAAGRVAVRGRALTTAARRSLGDPQDEPAEEHQREGGGGQKQRGKGRVLGDQPEACADEGEGGELDPEVGEQRRRLRHLRQIGVAGRRRKALASAGHLIFAAWRLCVHNPFFRLTRSREDTKGSGFPEKAFVIQSRIEDAEDRHFARFDGIDDGRAPPECEGAEARAEILPRRAAAGEGREAGAFAGVASV